MHLTSQSLQAVTSATPLVQYFTIIHELIIAALP